MKEKFAPAPSSEADGIIEGRNAVLEAIRAGTAIDKLYLLQGEGDAALRHIASTAREQGVVVTHAERRKLDAMSRTHAHQGVIAVAAVREYASVEDILAAYPAGQVPDPRKFSLRPYEEIEPCMREPLSEGWKSVHELPRRGMFID